MANCYRISDNSFDKRGFPWIDEIIEGLVRKPPCSNCGGISIYPSGEILVHLEKRKGTKWPDVIGCGHGLLFIVTEKVIQSWQKESIGEIPIHRVHIQKPYPRKLENTRPPEYYWVDGKQLKGASLDFEASGFVDSRFCQECGRLLFDVEKTHVLQNSQTCPYVLIPNSWNGLHLFTTDLSYRSFFCTEELLECAKKYKLTNFRFTPIEEGKATASKGIDYLK